MRTVKTTDMNKLQQKYHEFPYYNNYYNHLFIKQHIM